MLQNQISLCRIIVQNQIFAPKYQIFVHDRVHFTFLSYIRRTLKTELILFSLFFNFNKKNLGNFNPLVPSEKRVPMRRIPCQFDEFAMVREKAHKNQTKNDMYKIQKAAYYEIKKE